MVGIPYNFQIKPNFGFEVIKKWDYCMFVSASGSWVRGNSDGEHIMRFNYSGGIYIS
jgi:hypothetical protein